MMCVTSAALDIAAQIQAAGAVVTVHDPKAIANAQKRFPALNFADNVEATCESYAGVSLCHLTEWKMLSRIRIRQE
jgi:UDPglucose 6-dehydrogenase